ncbi:hypothetical protein NQT74_10790 [Alteromonas stellipolaris]|uniref:hypothetical protein n=1 Tax=Alteromonas stellipolaris TaxID=233316 RepID=UPI002118414E|nr:hypothetical protein [Alteromonas stellipolaris]MCQ8849067.1 hypothetical protein [Alteromonas stellipolaris]
MEKRSMVREYDSQPSFDNIKQESPGSRTDNNEAKTSQNQNGQPLKSLDVSDLESKFIQKARKKIRLFDPEGIYQFKGSAIPYYQSFLHLISLLVSLYLIAYYFAVIIFSELEHLDGVGNTSYLTTIDKLFMVTLAALTVFKLKKLISVKITHYDVRYKLALAANGFNRIVINLVKFSIYFLALALFIIGLDHPNETILGAFDRLGNGVIADSLTFFSWIVTTLIFVKAFKHFGKE